MKSTTLVESGYSEGGATALQAARIGTPSLLYYAADIHRGIFAPGQSTLFCEKSGTIPPPNGVNV